MIHQTVVFDGKGCLSLNVALSGYTFINPVDAGMGSINLRDPTWCECKLWMFASFHNKTVTSICGIFKNLIYYHKQYFPSTGFHNIVT